MANYLHRLIASGARTSSLQKPPAAAPVLLPPIYLASAAPAPALLEPLPQQAPVESVAPAPLVFEKTPVADAPASAPNAAPVVERSREADRPAASETGSTASSPSAQTSPATDISAPSPGGNEARNAPVRPPVSLPASLLRPVTAAVRVQAPKALRTSGRTTLSPQPPPQPRQPATVNPAAPVRNDVTPKPHAPAGKLIDEVAAATPPDGPRAEASSYRSEPERRPAVASAKVDTDPLRSKPSEPAATTRPTKNIANSRHRPRPEKLRKLFRRCGPRCSRSRDAKPPLPPLHAAPAKARSRITIGRIDVQVNNRPSSQRQAPAPPASRGTSSGWLDMSDLYPFTCKL